MYNLSFKKLGQNTLTLYPLIQYYSNIIFKAKILHYLYNNNNNNQLKMDTQNTKFKKNASNAKKNYFSDKMQDISNILNKIRNSLTTEI